jgi:FSR family fosmidomycin resistance protein-like MFS transporter
MKHASRTRVAPAGQTSDTVFKVLGAISFSHFLDDMMRSLMPAIYPLFKTKFQLNFAQIGLITLTYQLTTSVADR